MTTDAVTPTHLIGTTTIAGWFGVRPVTVRGWRSGHKYRGFPKPDYVIPAKGALIPGWGKHREEEIRQWYKTKHDQRVLY